MLLRALCFAIPVIGLMGALTAPISAEPSPIGLGRNALAPLFDPQGIVPADTLHRKLYVSDFGSNAIYEFPLINGKPVSAPANEITGLNGPISIAFDAKGNLYESNLGTAEILVFGPRASGNAKPKSRLHLPQGAYAVAVDANGYLYAQGGFRDVYVYAPGAKGNPRPLFDLTNFPGGAVESVAIAPNGSLYVASWAVNGALVYTTPETNPTLQGEFVDASLSGPIGLGFDRREMYVVDSGNNAVKAYSIWIGTVSPDRVITSSGFPMATPTDIDAYANNLFVTNPSSGSAGSTEIFQFNPRIGPQHPKSVLVGSGTSGFSNAQDAQLGP